MISNVDFFWKAGRNGVLLIHGLTGAPAEMRQVAKGFHEAGYTVYGMQLAGHCGDEADLLTTTWQDWYQSVVQAAQRLSEHVDKLYLAGLSMGALLALKYAQEQPHRVHGLALYGTTFRYDGWAIPKIAKLSFLLPLILKLGFGHKRRFMETHPYGLKDERLRKRILQNMNSGDSTLAGLPGNPWPSLAQLFALSGQVRAKLSQVRAPCLVVHATHDDIASTKNARLIVDNVAGKVSLLLLENSYHMVTIDQEYKALIERSLAFFDHHLGAENVVPHVTTAAKSSSVLVTQPVRAVL